MDSTIPPRCILLAVLILAGGFFSGAETAYSYCNRIRMKTMADEGKRSAKRVVAITEDFDRMLVTVLIMINVLHVLTSAVATLLAVELIRDAKVATLVSTVLTTIVVFFISENIPKSLAKENCDAYALVASPVIRALMIVLTPISLFFTKIGDLFKKMLRADEKAPSITEDEFSDLVDKVEDEGLLEPEESRIIQSAVSFADVQVKDIFTPVENVVCVEKGMDEEEILSLLQENNFSRMPVYDHDYSHVVGILQTKEYLTAYLNRKEDGEELELREYMQPVYYVKPDMNLDDLFESMGRRRSHFAVVAKNEAMLGVVTMEDLLENLVGEIYDEDETPEAAGSGEVPETSPDGGESPEKEVPDRA